MTDGKKFWLSDSEYMDYLWSLSPNSNEGCFHYTVMEIAVNLHNIAQQLAEMNGYVPPKDGDT